MKYTDLEDTGDIHIWSIQHQSVWMGYIMDVLNDMSLINNYYNNFNKNKCITTFLNKHEETDSIRL